MKSLQFSTNSSWVPIFSKTTLFIFFIAVIVFDAPFSQVLAGTEVETSARDGLQVLVDQKKKLERYMFILVEHLEYGDITPKELRTGQDFYDQARAARDRWIAQFQKQIQEKQDPALSKEYQQLLQKAGESSEEFLEYVHSVDNSRGDVAERTRKILDELQRSARALWAVAIGSPSQTVDKDLENQTLATSSQIEAQSKTRNSP